MELVYGDVNMETLVCMPCAQAEVEGELPLPEGRRASDTEVLSANGAVTVSKCAAAEGAVVIEGRVRAELVCRDASFVPEEGGNAAGALFAFSSSAAFRYVMDAPNVKEGMTATAQAAIVELNVEQGGRLAFSSTVELNAVVTRDAPVHTLNGVRGITAEFKNVSHVSLAQTLIGSEEVRVREEIACRGVTRVLCAYAQASPRSVKAGGDTAIVDATGYVTALIENEAGHVEPFTTQFPLTLELALDERPRGEVVVEIAAMGAEAYVLGEGIICFELSLRVKVFDICAQESNLPGDAYIPGAAMASACESVELMLRGGHVQMRCNVDEKLQIPEGMPPLSRVVWCAARPLVTSATAECGRLCVEGLLAVRAVYETAECAAHAFGVQVPFACETSCLPWCCGAQASAKVLCAGLVPSGGALVFSAVLEIAATPYCRKPTCYVAGLEECEAKEGRRSLILCYAGAGETLFDIGRRYGLSRAQLEAANPGVKEELTEGQKLVFIGRA